MPKTVYLDRTSNCTFSQTDEVVSFGLGSETVRAVRKSPEECDRLLRSNEIRSDMYDLCTLAANAKNEDTWAVDRLSDDRLRALRAANNFWEVWSDMRGSQSGQYVFASVFDGHGGSAIVSELLKRTMHACLAHALSEVSEEQGEKRVKRIKEVFSEVVVRFDDNVTELPITGLGPGPSNPALFGLYNFEGPGSTQATAFIDQARQDLYVIGCGDTRVVGIWKSADGELWRVEAMTEDHIGDNPNEQARQVSTSSPSSRSRLEGGWKLIKALHPGEDENDLIQDEDGYLKICGVLHPSRAIGGNPGKRSPAESTRLDKVFDYKTWRGKPHGPTPPYKNATPDVRHWSLNLSNGEHLDSLVIGSDGLFERLTTEQVGLLIIAHRTHPIHPPIPKSELINRILLKTTQLHLWPDESCTIGQGNWIFQDDNAATHLVRNSLPGFGDQEVVNGVLSVPGGDAKKLRDDVTALVIRF